MHPAVPARPAGPSRARRLVLVLLPFLALAACRSVEASVWNLREVHEPDGSPRRVGRVQSEIAFQISQLLESLRFRGPGPFVPEEERIEDPHGVCLESLLGLARGSLDDARMRGLQAELFTWLAVDDHSTLSRERAVLELGRLGRALGVAGPAEPPAQPAGPADVADALGELLRQSRPLLTGQASFQGLGSGDGLQEACAAVAALELDREGARRLVGALNVLLARTGFENPAALPARALHDDLQRRAVAQALAAALGDEDARVRAAAFGSALGLGERSPALLLAGLGDPEPEVVERVLDVLIEGAGEDAGPGVGQDPETLALLVRHASDREGPVSTRACRALSRISGEPSPVLRPEVWAEWWLARSAPGSGADSPR